jgi:nitrate reductase assembly molybdenum cofactor insertion protein NarJ
VTTTGARDVERTIGSALARSAAYRALAQALADPTPEGLARLAEEDLPFALAVADVLPGAVRDALAEVAAAFSGASPEDVEREYRRVFTHVHSADHPAFETDLTARDVWRQAREMADLAGFYRAFGMATPGERPDHVAVELEFLQLVSYKAAWAAARRDPEGLAVCARAEEGFLSDHALRWMPELAARLAATGGPYGAVGRALGALLRAEAERLGVAVAGPAGEGAPGPPVPEEEVGLCEEGG